MNKPIEGLSPYEQPHLVTSRDKITFDSRAKTWPLSAKINFDVQAARDRVGIDLMEGLEATFRNLASTRAGPTVAQYGLVLSHFQAAMFPGKKIRRWALIDFQNYRAKLIEEFGNETYLVKLRAFLKHWAALRQPGLEPAVTKALEGMNLTQYETGRAVRTSEPNEGPLTPDELHHLALDIYKACEDGRLDLQDLSLATFHIVTGRRSGQSAALKCKDVDRSRSADPEPGQAEGERLLLLHVPRLKQGLGFRGSLRSVHLLQTYFALFEAQRELVAGRLQEMLAENGFTLQPKDLQQLQGNMALYPFWEGVIESLDAASALREQGQHAQALETLRLHSEGQFWHLSSSQINRHLQSVVKTAGTLARDGTPLQFSPTRLRYTKGTELARQGVGLEVMAWLMDHSNIESVAVYIDNVPEHASAVNAAMSGSLLLKRIASLFRGRVVDSEVDAIGDEDPRASRIHYKGEPAASCGARKQCGLGDGIPRACYTCDRFEPWLNGPHDVVLQDLLQERKRDSLTLGVDHPVTKRRDKTIIAVINVIQQCETRRRSLAEEDEGTSE